MIMRERLRTVHYYINCNTRMVVATPRLNVQCWGSAPLPPSPPSCFCVLQASGAFLA